MKSNTEDNIEYQKARRKSKSKQHKRNSRADGRQAILNKRNT